MFPKPTPPEEFGTATMPGHFGFAFEENSSRKITLLWRCHYLPKAPFSKCFPSKRKAGVFKFHQFEERFEKLRFRDGLM